MIFSVRSCGISIRRRRKWLFAFSIIGVCIATIIFIKLYRRIKHFDHEKLSSNDRSKSDTAAGGDRGLQEEYQKSGRSDSEEDYVNYNVHAFYYAWYKSPAVDGKWSHWNHIYLSNWEKNDKKVYPTGQHEPPEDIGSNYFPLLGCYSSQDSSVIHEHMKYFRVAGVGVLVLSWHPPGTADESTEVLPHIMDVALQYNIKICLHIEPYNNRDPQNLLAHLSKFMETYGSHPALHKVRRPGHDSSSPKLPLYYIYDSYLTPSAWWKEMFSAKGNVTVRGTHLDGVFLGLLVELGHQHEIARAHFDGFYTYFATNGFTYGSSWKNWRSLSMFALQNKLMFVPSVGPGYIDTQVRPWNARNTRHRGYGKYYGVAWRSALSLPVPAVSITSFNEWHEGTQIEPAVPFRTSSFVYLSYEPQDPFFYLNLTRTWVKEYTKKDKSAISNGDIAY